MRILQISTYPTVQPRHGGQIRVTEIQKWLKSNGHETRVISVTEPSHANYDKDNDLIIDLSGYKQPHELPFCTDLLTANLSEKNPQINDFIMKHVRDFSPTVIFLEQAWLWPAIKGLIKKGALNSNEIKIVYSSQNIESETKRSILQAHNQAQHKIDSVVQEIEHLEKDLIEHSDFVIAVTQKDANYFSQWSKNTVIVCPNGVARRNLSTDAVNRVDAFVQNRKFVVFIGSAYPPNAQGFWEMMGPSLASLPPDTMIIVIGGVGQLLEAYAPPSSDLFKAVNFRIIKALGMVEDDLLAALIDRSKGLILPITSGGGSNLKTAEAIAANKPFVLTPMAARGFNDVSKLNNAFICNSPHEFIAKVADILNKDWAGSQGDEIYRESMYWEHSLKDLRIICPV